MMKTFEEYKDGDWVTYLNPNSNWHEMMFQAYPSKWTKDAFRLKYGDREVIADISEVKPMFTDDMSKTVAQDQAISGMYGILD